MGSGQTLFPSEQLSSRNKDGKYHFQVLFGTRVNLGTPGCVVQLENIVVNG